MLSTLLGTVKDCNPEYPVGIPVLQGGEEKEGSRQTAQSTVYHILLAVTE